MGNLLIIIITVASTIIFMCTIFFSRNYITRLNKKLNQLSEEINIIYQELDKLKATTRTPQPRRSSTRKTN